MLPKMEGVISQDQKALSMLTSRKVVSISSFSQPGGISLVKVKIQNSFGDQIYPATTPFSRSNPSESIV